ncbi:MAG TPA: nuclear transport factor 2 family protein [Mucilaginibacter sp.]|jgi:ketosteroid isomerase-like protein|nr:nuclear transport factor 2 family protein [Mucilaginibacter sp.]
MKNKLKKIGVGCLFAITLLLLTIHCTAQSSKESNEKIVRAVYTAYEKKDWNMLKPLFADGFTFNSPNDDHIDLKEYKVRCWPNSANIKKFDIEKLVVDGDDAFVLYNGRTNDGRVFRNTEYFKLKDGKIKEFTCFFGPGISFPNNTKK